MSPCLACQAFSMLSCCSSAWSFQPCTACISRTDALKCVTRSSLLCFCEEAMWLQGRQMISALLPVPPPPSHPTKLELEGGVHYLITHG